MESPLRLIAANPVDRLARTVEALLVVSSAPLSLDELATEWDADAIVRHGEQFSEERFRTRIVAAAEDLLPT